MTSVFWKLLYLSAHLQLCSSVIYNLNASEYKKLPALFHLDPYESCAEEPGAVYCTTEFVPVSDVPNTLLDTIREYSAHTPTHFNHTLMRYGICLNLCNQHNTTGDPKHTLEACLNESIWNKYKLNTSLQSFSCNEMQKKIEIEIVDIVMLVVLIVILLLNLIGSYCDVYLLEKKKGTAMRVLMTFSVRRNWRKLIAPSADGPDLRLKRLKGFAGFKSLTIFLVIFAHTLISVFFFVDNPKRVEDYYKDRGIHLFLNGSIMVQTFFVISGFLLVYNLLLLGEKRRVNWTVLPTGILLRLIRLTPPYAVLMLFTVSWMRFVGSGVTWDLIVISEVEDCRSYWWQHLLYINNYNDVSICFSHSWYLAADTQLYCLGLVVFLACRNGTYKKVVFSLLLLIAFVIPPLQTYFQDLDGILIVSPETSFNFYVKDPTFNNLYKRGHTNLFNYVLGLFLGYVVYHLQQINFDIQKYKKYKIILWVLLPAYAVFMMYSGSFYYRDAPRPPMALRMAVAALCKPLYGVCFGIAVMSLVFKYEKVYRFVLEWRMWSVVGRLSYCTYLVHATILRVVLAQGTTLVHISNIFMSQQAIQMVILSLLAAVPFWLLVEQPCGQFFKVFLAPEKALDDENTLNKYGTKEDTDIASVPEKVSPVEVKVDLRFKTTE